MNRTIALPECFKTLNISLPPSMKYQSEITKVFVIWKLEAGDDELLTVLMNSTLRSHAMLKPGSGVARDGKYIQQYEKFYK